MLYYFAKKKEGLWGMKIAICEDDRTTGEQLKQYVEEFMSEKGLSCPVFLFASAGDFFASAEDFDLLLLDYSLPDTTGMELARKIRLTNRKTVIVFITAYSEYVFESFEVDTFRYLLKPVEKEELFKTLNMFLNHFEQYAKVEIPLTTGTIFVTLQEIMYIESNGRYTTVRMNSSSYTSTKSLSAFHAEINSFRFFRTHRTFLVNMKYIAEVDGHIITLTNGEKVEISRRNLTTFNKCYMNFLRYSDF